MSTHVTALFKDRLTAHSAVEQLVQAGFCRDDLSVLMSDSTHAREFAGGLRSERGSASTTGVLGSIVADIAAIALCKGFLAAGPIAAALGRVGGFGFAGTLTDALSSAGVAPHEARSAWEKVWGGAILVGVAAQRERARLARALVMLSGGHALEAA